MVCLVRFCRPPATRVELDGLLGEDSIFGRAHFRVEYLDAEPGFAKHGAESRKTGADDTDGWFDVSPDGNIGVGPWQREGCQPRVTWKLTNYKD